MRQQVISYIGFEVSTAVVNRARKFSDIKPYILLKVNRRFEGICRHHLQGRGISQTRNESEAGNERN
jgi:hypothetical protein